MAATLDVLTLAEARTALRQGAGTANDTVIANLVTAASLRLDQGVGPIVTRTIVGDTYDGLSAEWAPGRGGSIIQLRSWPVGTVTTVTEDGVTLADTGWYIDTETGQLFRILGRVDYPWSAGRDNVAVTYTAGRFTDTASVDWFYKEGAVLLLRHLWGSEQWAPPSTAAAEFDAPQVRYPSFAVPRAVIDWFGPLWRQSSRDTAEPRGGFV